MEMNTDIDTRPIKRQPKHHCSATGTTRHCTCNKEKIQLRVQKCSVDIDSNGIISHHYPVSINARKNWEILDSKEPLIFTKVMCGRTEVCVKTADGKYVDNIATKCGADNGRIARKNLRKEKAQHKQTRKNHKMSNEITNDAESRNDDDDHQQRMVSPLVDDTQYFNIRVHGAHPSTLIDYDKIHTNNAVTKKSQTLSCNGSQRDNKTGSRSVKNSKLISLWI
eukprot:TRINITY_DN6735_c0_g1_i1.p1 TRINITY_DN6735_c0_g1~~TRINITY_DN6735_c0_g1_i1.p1  ORF type:complete len:223 (-),score=28.25 TRINITY_DN6735_c0_g1_i1:140-808(-)